MFNNILGDSGDSLLFFLLAFSSSCMLQWNEGGLGGVGGLETVTVCYSSSCCW